MKPLSRFLSGRLPAHPDAVERRKTKGVSAAGREEPSTVEHIHAPVELPRGRAACLRHAVTFGQRLPVRTRW